MENELGINIIQRFDLLKSETERQNFETIWQSASEFCSPQNDNINQISTAGDQKSNQRFIDVGIRSNRIFTSGMSSYLIPAGSKFFEYSANDPRLKNDDEVTRYWADVTRTTYDILNSSNFFAEVTKSIRDLGFIGTSCVLAEPTKENTIRFKSHYINQYYIAEDAYGMVDTVYFEMKLTNRQAYQLFGDDLSADVITKAKEPTTADGEVIIVHAIEPRVDYGEGTQLGDKRPIKSCYVEYTSKKMVKEDGYYEMPYAVGRFYQSTNEKYGRSPALECLITMGLVNTMEQTRINAAERVSNPPWLSPTDGSVRAISNQPGSIIYWDASNPAAKPEQLTAKDNVVVNDQMIQIKNEEIEDAFFLPLFNPLINRQNMTATESSQRMDIALQNLVPAIGRLTTEFLNPLFIRIYKILEKQGHFPELPEALQGTTPHVGFSSKATMAIKMLEVLGIYQTMEQVTFLAQFDPSILDNYDMDEIARLTGEANSVPTTILRSEFDVEDIRARKAEQAQAEQAQQQMADMADVYSKTSETPEAGSGASALMQQAGL